MKAIEMLENHKKFEDRDLGYYDDEYNEAISEIEALQSQIEKMKCCENCKHAKFYYGQIDCNKNCIGVDDGFKMWECR